MKEVKLPSGAILKINMAPFSDSKALYKSLLAEIKSISISSETQFASVFKDIYCAGFSSDKVETALWPCMKRCLYNELKVDESTFEPVSAREDYTKVCLEVAQENVLPFVKDLSAVYRLISQEAVKSPA